MIYISDSYFLLNLVFLMDKQTKPTNHLGNSKNEAEKQIKRAGAPGLVDRNWMNISVADP